MDLLPATNAYLEGDDLALFPELQGTLLKLTGEVDSDTEHFERLGGMDPDRPTCWSGNERVSVETAKGFILHVDKAVTIRGKLPETEVARDGEIRAKALARVLAQVVKACGPINWEAAR